MIKYIRFTSKNVMSHVVFGRRGDLLGSSWGGLLQGEGNLLEKGYPYPSKRETSEGDRLIRGLGTGHWPVVGVNTQDLVERSRQGLGINPEIAAATELLSLISMELKLANITELTLEAKTAFAICDELHTTPDAWSAQLILEKAGLCPPDMGRGGKEKRNLLSRGIIRIWERHGSISEENFLCEKEKDPDGRTFWQDRREGRYQVWLNQGYPATLELEQKDTRIACKITLIPGIREKTSIFDVQSHWLLETQEGLKSYSRGLNSPRKRDQTAMNKTMQLLSSSGCFLAAAPPPPRAT